MRFKIEQVALCPDDPEAAKELLIEMGADEWIVDKVRAQGVVFGLDAENEAQLSFEYAMLTEAKELEVLNYTDGFNWMAISKRPRVSHFGMHCTEEELAEWKRFFAARHIMIAQEVETTSHTNPAIAGKRWYHYVIFDTHHILGVDIKFIVRHDNADI